MRNGEERRCAQIRAREHQRLCLCSSFKAQLFKFHTTTSMWLCLPIRIMCETAFWYILPTPRTNLNMAQKNLQTSLREGLVIKCRPETLHTLQKKDNRAGVLFMSFHQNLARTLTKYGFWPHKADSLIEHLPPSAQKLAVLQTEPQTTAVGDEANSALTHNISKTDEERIARIAQAHITLHGHSSNVS